MPKSCLALVTALVLQALLSDQTVAKSLRKPPCKDIFCKSPREQIKAFMNRSANPCNNMFDYACGHWVDAMPDGESGRANRIREADKKIEAVLKKVFANKKTTLKGKESAAIKKLKTFYNSCMDIKRIRKDATNKILKMVDQFGSWTVTKKSLSTWNRATWSLQHSLEQIHQLNIFRSPLFRTGILPDPKKQNKNAFMFSQAGLTKGVGYYKRRMRWNKKKFLDYTTKLIVRLGGRARESRAKMEKVFQFEKKLSEIFVPAEKYATSKDRYNDMTVGEFQTMIGNSINIEAYLNARFKGVYTFSEGDIIYVKTPDYFKKLGAIIAGTDSEVLANYMMWHVIRFFFLFTPSSPTASKKEEKSHRWEQCIGYADVFLGPVKAALYIEDNFSPQSKARAISILKDLQNSFMDHVDHITWLDEMTKYKIKDKAEYVDWMVGYPDWIMDVDQLDARYEKVTVEPGQFIDNVIALTEHWVKGEMEKFTLEPNRDEWDIMPDEANAGYHSTFNAVIVPAGILQPPVFSPDYPDAFLYGSLGGVVGHELLHGFDDSGRHHDKYGVLADDLWTEKANKQFNARAQCFVDQYTSYSMYGMKLNGVLTLGENIADNGAVKFAHAAMIKKKIDSSPFEDISNEELYFIGFSQLWCEKISKEKFQMNRDTNFHTVGKYRVIVPLSNSPEFAKAFSCPEGSPLNPRKKCSVW